MTVSILVEGILKDEFKGVLQDVCAEAFLVTRSFEGCQNISLTLNVENDKNFVLTEIWDSEEHYKKYFNFRVKDGTINMMKEMCSNGPEIRIFQINDA